MPASLFPPLKFKGTDANGKALAGGKLYTYLSGTNTPMPTYRDSAMLTVNTNPVILDAAGEAYVLLDLAINYRLELRDANNAQIYVIDNVMGDCAGSVAGPQGPEGPQGPQGLQGPQGATGYTGNVIMADSYASLSAAYNAGVATYPSGGFAIHLGTSNLPMGTSIIVSVPNVTIFGDSQSAKITCTNGQGITVNAVNFAMHDCAFEYATASTSGITLKLLKSGVKLHNVGFRYAWIAIEIDGTAGGYIGGMQFINLDISEFQQHAIKATKCIDVVIKTVYSSGKVDTLDKYSLYLVGFIEGWMVDTFIGLYSSYYINGTGTHGSTPSFNSFINCGSDAGKYANLIQNTLATTFKDCWFANARETGEPCVRYYGNKAGRFDGNGISNGGGRGLELSYNANCTIVNNAIIKNSVFNPSANAPAIGSLGNNTGCYYAGNITDNSTYTSGSGNQANIFLCLSSDTGVWVKHPTTVLTPNSGDNTNGFTIIDSSGGGDVYLAGNNVFTETNNFNNAVGFNAGLYINDGIHDKNVTKGANGQVLTTDGTDVVWATPATVITDHGGLTGLADDDHAQYHNDARGDARYVALTGNQTVAGNKTLSGNTVFNGTIELNTGLLDSANSQGISGQLLKSGGTGVAPTWTSLSALLKAVNGTEIDGTGDFIKFAKGTGSIPSGSSTYLTTITHGLGFVPDAGEINVTPTSSYGFGWQIANITSTTFQVIYSNNTAALNFGWSVIRFNP